jgi:hypothetical protein
MTETTPPFRVTLTPDPEPVIRVWSSYQIQFQASAARPWRRQLLDELRDALARLDLSAGRLIAGVYMTTGPMSWDPENQLFLNPDPAVPAVTGVRFERCPRPPPTPPQPIEASAHLHYYEYRAAAPARTRSPQWRCYRAVDVLATWHRVPQPLPFGDSARPWWIAMRRAAAAGHVELPASTGLSAAGNFGVRLTIHGAALPRSLRGSREHVIDGVLAAFHAATADPGSVRALAVRAGPALAEEVTRYARTDGPGPLFPTTAITTAGYLSPDDTRCWAGEVTLLRGDAAGGVPQLSGELVTLATRLS